MMLRFKEFLRERTLSGREKAKKEEIVLALKRKHPDWEKSKIYAIATASAKKAINEDYVFLAEAKNLHMEHLEDEIFNNGIDGAKGALRFMDGLLGMLKGDADRAVDITVKFDGAPAIFAGIDPDDGQFFVGTKGVFNANPKLVKSESDVNLHFSGGLADKVRIAYNELKDVGISGVLQGDIMFTKSDLSETTIDGEQYIIFQPNTIVYAVPSTSELARKIEQANIGIVFHTTYKGTTLADMDASFGANIESLGQKSTLWISNADYDDMSGTIAFTADERNQAQKLFIDCESSLERIDTREFDLIMDAQKLLPSSVVGAKIKTYINSLIRGGSFIVDPERAALSYIDYISAYYDDKVLPKLKTDKGRNGKILERDTLIRSMSLNMRTFTSIFEHVKYVYDLKLLIIRKLDMGAKRFPGTFIKTENGYKVTNDEGYVAIDKIKGSAVKLVDRLEFSYNNFTGVKNWN